MQVRSFWVAIGCALFAGSALGAGAVADEAGSAGRRGNVLTLRKAPPSQPDHTRAVAGFVRLAAAQDADALLRTFDEVPVRANGEAAIRHFVVTEVMPFFAGAERVDASMMRVTAASFEDGGEGHMAYTYVITTTGQAKPFVIAWRGDAAAPRVMDLQLGRCVKARHPVAPGRCDSAR